MARTRRKQPTKVFATVLLFLAACGPSEPTAPPLVNANFVTNPVPSGEGGLPPPTLLTVNPTDALPDGACGTEEVQASQDPANVYFVLDRSASMAATEKGVSRYVAVRNAAVHLVETLGWRFRFGANLFPSVRSGGCDAGIEVFALQQGDAKSYADQQTRGPVTQQFARALLSDPQGQFAGATPTAATLQQLTATLTSLGKNTYVLLATDGAPNCNPEVRCDRSRCIPNVEQAPFCPVEANCCDPNDPRRPETVPWSWSNCLEMTLR